LIAIVPAGHLNDKEEIAYQIRDTFTPLAWRKRYNLMKGSTHGLCHNLAQLAYFRPANRHGFRSTLGRKNPG
jgi:phytoene dehydrogenase-like protein